MTSLEALSDDITLQEVLAALRELEDGDNSTKKPEESEVRAVESQKPPHLQAQSDQETNKEVAGRQLCSSFRVKCHGSECQGGEDLRRLKHKGSRGLAP